MKDTSGRTANRRKNIKPIKYETLLRMLENKPHIFMETSNIFSSTIEAIGDAFLWSNANKEGPNETEIIYRDNILNDRPYFSFDAFIDSIIYGRFHEFSYHICELIYNKEKVAKIYINYHGQYGLITFDVDKKGYIKGSTATHIAIKYKYEEDNERIKIAVKNNIGGI